MTERDVDDLDVVSLVVAARPIRARRSRRWCFPSNRRQARATPRCPRSARCPRRRRWSVRRCRRRCPRHACRGRSCRLACGTPLTKSLKARMRLNGRSACGAMPESMIATDNAGARGLNGGCDCVRTDESVRDLSRAGGDATRPEHRRRAIPAMRATNSLLNAAALPNTTSAGPASVSIARTAAPRSRRSVKAAIALRGRRKLHDDARGLTRIHGGAHRAIGVAGPRRSNGQHTQRERRGQRPPGLYGAIACRIPGRAASHAATFSYIKRLSTSYKRNRISLLQPDLPG